MKNKLFPTLSIALITAFSILSTAPARSYSKVKYICETSGSFPITYVITSKEKIEFITWKSQAFRNSGYPAEKRCQLITERFQKHSDAGNLRYITTGKINHQKVICVARSKNSSCISGGLLLTLESKDNPKKVLTELFNVSTRKQKMSITRGKPIYIDVDAYLSNVYDIRQSQPIKAEPTYTKPSQNQPVQKETTNSDDNCSGSFFCN
ncbi:COP23 domain-containing protein [Mastigocoleus testarum]|uniref:Uncharacterized protein n=1 Tax=Mastigocoleus testarum BC008 TaxID=371196 RepID=A0A0V8A0U0_9CYAN|nr:COP23 domain-containing protein [Mastigocoleus testarum]KST70315.1 hypothetical protein BC008_44745 [Mastigocoleus testarum BC008]